MSIIRVGLAETKKFAEGYASIFGNKKKKAEQEQATEQPAQEKEVGDKKAGKADKKKGKK